MNPRICVTLSSQASAFAGKEGEAVLFGEDAHGKYAYVRFDDDPRLLRFGASEFEFIEPPKEES